MQTMVLFGTAHKIQAGIDLRSANLETRLQSVCDQFSIRGIGEELNRELLNMLQVSASIGERVATHRSICHKYCDPDREQRRNLGTTTEAEINAEADQQGWSSEQRAENLATHCALREHFWLKQIDELGVSPVLFICGADHVPTFSRRASERGYKDKVADRDWGA